MVMDTGLGGFEQLVLLALVRLEEDAYGVTVAREIEARTGRVPNIGTIYKTLMRLEAKGFVTAELGDPTPQRGGRRKKFYRITTRGRGALAAALRTLRRMTRGLDPAWGSP